MRRTVLALRILSRFLLGMIFVSALIMVPAWSLSWDRGWRFIIMIASLMIVTMTYFIIRDPELVEKRLRMRERRSRQKGFVAASTLLIFPIFILPGLDWRFGWSEVPESVSWAGIALAALSYCLLFAVMLKNTYASRVVEIQAGQKVIDTGPYAVVRHPMYSAMVPFYSACPLALGSWWAFVPTIAFLFLLPLRIRDEEAMLREGLPGYVEYCAKVRWRLIPGLW